MRITESQLRRIIRREVRALRESEPRDGFDQAAYRAMTPAQMAQYWKDRNAELLKKQRAAAAGAAAPMPEPRVDRGMAPSVTGGAAKLRPVAQAAVDDLYRGDDAEDVVQFIVNQTAKYEPGYEPTGGFRDFDHIVSDRASEVIGIIRRVDPAAAAELEAALAAVYAG